MRQILIIVITSMICCIISTSAYAGTKGNMLDGYDPVSYFQQGGPKKGADITLSHEGVTYAFSSQKNADLFKSNPDKYTPQFGGNCAYGMVFGSKSSIDPTIWKIVDEKLYFMTNVGTHKLWSKKASQYIKRAEKAWNTLN